MLTSYAAYLIRCWRDQTGLTRVEIVHVQSGERALAGTTAAALAWIDSHGANVFSGQAAKAESEREVSGNGAD